MTDITLPRPAPATIVLDCCPWVATGAATLEDKETKMAEFHSGAAYAAETDGLSGVKALKAPVPQESYIMANTATVQTLEGVLTYEAGKVLTEGAKKELYAFDQAYMNANMDIEGSLVTAEVPDGISSMDQLRSAAGPGFVLRKKQVGMTPVSAYQIGEPFSVATSWGETMNGQPGGWLIEEDKGGTCNRWVVAEDVFRMTYNVV